LEYSGLCSATKPDSGTFFGTSAHLIFGSGTSFGTSARTNFGSGTFTGTSVYLIFGSGTSDFIFRNFQKNNRNKFENNFFKDFQFSLLEA
jgi:hypothetical protein